MKPTPTDSQVTRLLLLIRHGRAVPKVADLDDFERVLTADGVAQCRVVGKKLQEMNLSVDMMLSSPADRALETAHSFAPLLSFPVHRIRIASVLYVPGSVRQIMSRLRALPDDVRTVAVVGHNPSLEDLSAYLVRDYSGGLPKGAVAGVAVNTRAWAQLRKGTASLQFLVTPLDSGKKAPARRRPLR